ncbi:hypothetical protein FM113_15385 [Leucobacter sp. 7(1)]|uniref:iron chaperone n=1 Tax=Leucobacter sp. 7(1) TaxID=1255613 RepID=UPI00097E8116|nr:DUF1801 domain-containing protein [Leucobacter sp. 7(1)]SJN12628.1 hypothetical protein FM113_15385 [Leucobacter sp. 7(1)]
MSSADTGTEVTEYLTTLAEPERTRIAQLFARAQALAPDAVEGRSYGMPSLLYRGKGLLSIVQTRKHIGVYPHGNLGELADAVTAAGLGSTKGSIHLGAGQDLSDELLAQFVQRRIAQIDASAAR